MTITSAPNIYPLAIPHDTKLASNRIFLAWKTDIACDTSIYYRKSGEQTFEKLSVSTQSLEHRVALENLEFFTYYEFYTESTSSCGETTTSPTYQARTGKAIKFVDDVNEFWIDRDYNQRVTLSITNTDIIEHNFSLSVINSNEDIQIGFVGDGTPQRETLLAAGESRDVELVMNAVDALSTDYDFYLQIVSDKGRFDSFLEVVHAIAHVRPFAANLAMQPVASTPGTMTTRFRLVNYGDQLSDIEVFVDAQSQPIITLDPVIHHWRLDTGGYVEFDIAADRYITGTVYARSGSHIVSAPFEIGCGPDTSLETYTVTDVSIVASIKDWYCTNKMNIELPFAIPRGFGHEDISGAALEIRFELPMAFDKYDPHNVVLSINGEPVAKFENEIPQGTHMFRFPASLINLGLDAPASNIITLDAEGITPGHYIVATDFRIILNVDQMQVDMCTSPPPGLFPPAETLPDPHTRITSMTPASKFRPGQTVTVTTVLANDDSVNNPPHQGKLTVNLTNNSANGIVPVESQNFDVTIAGGQRQTVTFDYTIPETADDIDYSFSASFENNTLNETVHYSRSGFWVRTPLILVHGMMGSELYETASDTHELWSANKVAFSPCDNFMEDLNCLDRETCNIQATSVIREAINLKIFGKNEIIFGDVFNGLEGYLQGERYKLNRTGADTEHWFDLNNIAIQAADSEDIFYFVYDWRQDNVLTAQDLTTFITNVTAAQNYPRVNIVAHSMGGLVCKSMMKQDSQIKDQINKLIFIGTPNIGAVETFSMFKHGLRAPRFGSVIPIEEIENNEELISSLNSLKSLLEIMTDPTGISLASGLTSAIENSLETLNPDFCSDALNVVNFIFAGLDFFTGDTAGLIGSLYDYYNLDKDLDGIRDHWIKQIIPEFPSVYQLLPSVQYRNYYPDGYYILDGQQINATSTPSIDVEFLRTFVDMPNLQAQPTALLAQAQTLHEDIDSGLELPEDTYAICGCKNSTAEVINENTDPLTLQFYPGDGDGTVPLVSSMHVDAKRKYVAEYAKHMNLPSHKGIRLLVRSLLSGEESNFPTSSRGPVEEYTQDSCGLPSGIRITIRPSSGTLGYIKQTSGTDSETATKSVDQWPRIRQVGTIGSDSFTGYTGNTIHLGILGSDYRITHDGIEIFVPDGAIYELEFKGVDSEYLDIKYEYMTKGGVDRTDIFYNIPIQPSGKGIINTDLTDSAVNPVMRIDNNGDGIFEEMNIPPTYNLDDIQSKDTIPPVSTVSLSGTIIGQSTYLPDVSIDLSASDNPDGSGVQILFYRMSNQSSFTEFTSPIIINEPGTYTLFYYSVDRSLNAETLQQLDFTIDDGAPEIVSALPSAGSTDTITSANIQITFSEPIDEASVTDNSILVSGSIGGVYSGVVIYDAASDTLTFNPDALFALGETVSVTISGALADITGITLDGNSNGSAQGSPDDDYQWSFVVSQSDGLAIQIMDISTEECPTVEAILIVTDDNGNAVTHLTETNFTVYVDDTAQSPITVEFVDQTTSPIVVALSLDYSGSMGTTAITDMENAAVEFINQLIPGDVGEIIKFANGIETAQSFTSDTTALVNAIYNPTILNTTATALYDAIYQAITDTADQAGRKSVIVMTDGQDTASLRSDSEVIIYAQSNGVSVFSIGLGTSINSSSLQAIASQTGGVYYEAPDSSDLVNIYQSISNVLKNQYVVSFSNSSLDGAEHLLRISAVDENVSGMDQEVFVTCLDSDNDGLIDSIEHASCTNPNDADTDDDGILDGTEDANHNGIKDNTEDINHNGILDEAEDLNNDGILNPAETNPCMADTDGDGIQDGTEIGLTPGDIGFGTEVDNFIPDVDPTTTSDPTLADSDWDGLSDGEEDINRNGFCDIGESNPSPQCGDVNDDCKVDLEDLIQVLKIVTNTEETGRASGDCNLDNHVGVPEAISILRELSE